MASGEGVGEIIPWKNNLVDSVLLFSFFPHTPSLSFPSSKLFFLLPHPPLTLLYSFHLHLNTQHHNFTLLPSFPHLQSFPSFTPPFPHSLTLCFPSPFFFYFNPPSPSSPPSLPMSHAPSVSHSPTSSPSYLRSAMFVTSPPSLAITLSPYSNSLLSSPFLSAIFFCATPIHQQTMPHTHTHTHTHLRFTSTPGFLVHSPFNNVHFILR